MQDQQGERQNRAHVRTLVRFVGFGPVLTGAVAWLASAAFFGKQPLVGAVLLVPTMVIAAPLFLLIAYWWFGLAAAAAWAVFAWTHTKPAMPWLLKGALVGAAGAAARAVQSIAAPSGKGGWEAPAVASLAAFICGFALYWYSALKEHSEESQQGEGVA